MADMCYIATTPCGCVGMLMADDYAHTKDGRKSISEALKRGYAIERVTHEQVRTMRTYCETCDPERVALKQQMSLGLTPAEVAAKLNGEAK